MINNNNNTKRIIMPHAKNKRAGILYIIGYIIFSIFVAVGLYLLVLIYIPFVNNIPSMTNNISGSISQINVDQDAIIIENINVNIPIDSSGIGALDNGAWHRYPDRGDPENGGNFIVSAHRFRLGSTPGQTWSKSYFYRLDRLKQGDTIMVVYNKKLYNYRVTRTYSVSRTATEIEQVSENHKLTLYSCFLSGEADGRVVVEAEQV